MAGGHKVEKGGGGGGGIEKTLLEMLPLIIVIVVGYFVYQFFQNGNGSDANGARAILGSVHKVWTVISTLLSMIFIGIGIYAWIKHTEHANHEAHELKHRFHHAAEVSTHRATTSGIGDAWKKIDGYVRSDNPSDWKIAILEADTLLEEVITSLGYHGENFGEKLKSINPSQFPYLDHAWEAHKFRNDIAHSAQRPLAHSEANRIIGLYERVFKELKVL